jgi:hypothetical protein
MQQPTAIISLSISREHYELHWRASFSDTVDHCKLDEEAFLEKGSWQVPKEKGNYLSKYSPDLNGKDMYLKNRKHPF